MSDSAEIFCRGILHCCINLGYRKSLDKSGGVYQEFPSKNLCLTVPKTSVGESFTVALILGIEKDWIRAGVINIFCRNFSVSQCRKFPWGISLLLHYFPVAKKFG